MASHFYLSRWNGLGYFDVRGKDSCESLYVYATLAPFYYRSNRNLTLLKCSEENLAVLITKGFREKLYWRSVLLAVLAFNISAPISNSFSGIFWRKRRMSSGGEAQFSKYDKMHNNKKRRPVKLRNSKSITCKKTNEQSDSEFFELKSWFYIINGMCQGCRKYASTKPQKNSASFSYRNPFWHITTNELRIITVIQRLMKVAEISRNEKR